MLDDPISQESLVLWALGKEALWNTSSTACITAENCGTDQVGPSRTCRDECDSDDRHATVVWDRDRIIHV